MAKEYLICIGDGDDIGSVIEFYLLKDDISGASKFSYSVKFALEKIAKEAQEQMKASISYVAGDDICFLVSSRCDVLKYLTSYSDEFLENTGKTISFGVAKSSMEAFVCLRKAKVSGKGCIVISEE